ALPLHVPLPIFQQWLTTSSFRCPVRAARGFFGGRSGSNHPAGIQPPAANRKKASFIRFHIVWARATSWKKPANSITATIEKPTAMLLQSVNHLVQGL